MTKHRTIVLTGTLMLGLGLVAPALADEEVIDQRRANEVKRITDGLRDASLTPSEATRLQREQARISREEQRFLSDGHLSPRERRHLLRDEERASRHIWRERHDRLGEMAPTAYLDRRLHNEP